MIVSIITVVKNDCRNIEKTINSVLSQNYKNIEYIVIDGQSKDGTLEILKKNRKKISKIVSGKDKNLYDAINKGIKISKGEIIGLLHSGDIYANRKVVSKSMHYLRNNNLDFVLSNLKIVNKDRTVFRNVKTSNFFKPFMLSMGIQPPHPTLFIKKKIIRKLSYYSINYKIVGDFDFFCKLFKNNKFKWRNIKYTSILQKRGGLSDGKLSDKILMSKQMREILSKHNFLSLKILFSIKFLLRVKEILFKK